MIDIDKAKELREQGYSYPKIAEELNCSVDWCKKNLASVSKNTQEKKAITQAIELAQSDSGITNGQIRQLVQTVYPYEASKEYEQIESKAMARFKAAINRSPNTVVRPYWMHPQNAQYSFSLVLSAVDAIMQNMTDEVNYISKQLDYNQSYDMSIRYAIIKLLLGSGLMPEGVENHCNTLSSIVDKLESKNIVGESADCTDMHRIYTCTEKCAPKKPSVQKCIVHENTLSMANGSEVQFTPDDGVLVGIEDVPMWIE